LDVLEDANVVSTLNLDCLMIGSLIDKEEFKFLLQYNIRKITVNRIRIDDGHAIKKLDSERLQVNSTLQKLEIDQFAGSYESLLGFFDSLKHYCPRLRSLQVSFDFSDAFLCPQYGLIGMEEILKKLPAIHEKLKTLQERGMSMSLSNLVIHANSGFRIPNNSTFDSDWPDKLKDHEGFKNIVDHKYGSMRVEFNSEYGFFTLTHQVEISREAESDSYDSDDYYGGYSGGYHGNNHGYLSADSYDVDYDSDYGRRCLD